MEVATVIVNYRSAGLVADCLRSLAPERLGLAVVVDNASPDDSVAQLRQLIASNNWSAWCHVVASERNAGYAAGNNIGIRHVQQAGVQPDYYLLLNPDTVVRPGAVIAVAPD